MFGSFHMAHSSYTMPLELALQAQPWDGDGIAEDHHAFLTCFFYRLKQTPIGGRFQNIDLRPVFLPVKSTAVANQDYLQSWSDRWSQAKRHARGVSELPYALLATYDAFMTQPWYNNRMLDLRVLALVGQALCRLFCMHLLPILQGLCLGMLTVTWFRHDRQIELCPDRLWLIAKPGDTSQTLLCGLAGAWVLTWPVVIPFILLMFSNFLLLLKCFMVTSSKATIWHSEDGQVPYNSSWRVAVRIIIDGIIGLSVIMFFYGFVVEVIAYFSVAICGNDFIYVTANKGCCRKRTKAKESKSYGTVEKLSKEQVSCQKRAKAAAKEALSKSHKATGDSTSTGTPSPENTPSVSDNEAACA
jgi:hypothetical protein